MKTLICSVGLLVMCYGLQAQDKWFHTYTDSAALSNDVDELAMLFVEDIQETKIYLNFLPNIYIGSSRYLTQYQSLDSTVYVPFWKNVTDELKDSINTIAGNIAEGQKMFGLYFNGFYLPHEFGHWFQYYVGKNNFSNSYDHELLANTIALLWWKKHGKEEDLKACYNWTKKILSQLKNPVPEGQATRDYFIEHSPNDLSAYAYMQFGQFIKLYEDKNLPDFISFIKELKRK